MWKTVRRFLKEVKTEPPYDPAVPFLDICKKKKKTHTHTPQNTNTKRYMHSNAHGSIIYNSQDTEAT